MYSVTLENGNCIFDSEPGFKTIAEAKEWASGRGGKYHVMIEYDNTAVDEYPLVADYWIEDGKVLED